MSNRRFEEKIPSKLKINEINLTSLCNPRAPRRNKTHGPEEGDRGIIGPKDGHNSCSVSRRVQLVEFRSRQRRASYGRRDAYSETLLAAFHAAIPANACELCATATSKRPPSAPASLQSRGVCTLGCHARQIQYDSPAATARCSARDSFDQSIPPGTSRGPQYQSSTSPSHRLD